MEEKETPRPMKSILKKYKPIPPFLLWLKSMKHERGDEKCHTRKPEWQKCSGAEDVMYSITTIA